MARQADTSIPPRLPYISMIVALVAALSLPVGLAIFNPTLMFERGWEQFAGSGLFIVAIFTLGGRLNHFWREEKGLIRAHARLHTLTRIKPAAAAGMTGKPQAEWVPAAGMAHTDSLAENRLEQLLNSAKTAGLNEFQQIMELNREQSSLDQEHEAGRFALTRYILYLLPVIGFIGTVEGISKALANISIVLPMVKDLDGFMNNLTSVTSALQIAFDSTLLALFLSATLMFVQTMMLRRAEDLLSRIDRWVVDQAIVPLAATKPQAEPEKLVLADEDLTAERWDALLQNVDEIARALGVGLGPQTERLQIAVDRLAQSLSGMDSATERLADFGSVGQQMTRIAEASARSAEVSARSGMALERIESSIDNLTNRNRTDSAIEGIRLTVERTTSAVESLNMQFQQSFEKSSRQSQDNLTRTLSSLRDAIELINVSIEQGNTLYKGIVRTMFDNRESDSMRKVG